MMTFLVTSLIRRYSLDGYGFCSETQQINYISVLYKCDDLRAFNKFVSKYFFLILLIHDY